MICGHFKFPKAEESKIVAADVPVAQHGSRGNRYSAALSPWEGGDITNEKTSLHTKHATRTHGLSGSTSGVLEDANTPTSHTHLHTQHTRAPPALQELIVSREDKEVGRCKSEIRKCHRKPVSESCKVMNIEQFPDDPGELSQARPHPRHGAGYSSSKIPTSRKPLAPSRSRAQHPSWPSGGLPGLGVPRCAQRCAGSPHPSAPGHPLREPHRDEEGRGQGTPDGEMGRTLGSQCLQLPRVPGSGDLTPKSRDNWPGLCFCPGEPGASRGHRETQRGEDTAALLRTHSPSGPRGRRSAHSRPPRAPGEKLFLASSSFRGHLHP